ncbi:AraC family transcriptional regulator [Daejeonella sp. JGW-45]|uniref:helix-turn-helix domain-containing protein n=1 Tax=Daejeonella sp. JGW-45 TaxID=3034148 RepID=UPI0023ECCA84|nr:AraC family transcriptional regulator [Daejeonella sp. JGW-45]
MKRFIQHDSLFIRHFTTTQWPFPVHKHDHFELMFIRYGEGYHYLNDVKYSYKGPCLFLLAPDDHHIFEIEAETEFSVLKLNSVYLSGEQDNSGISEWTSLIDQLLAFTDNNRKPLISSSEEMEKIGAMISLIVGEWTKSKNSQNETIFHLIRAVFSLLKRNVFSKIITHEKPENPLVIRVIGYIHQHIYHPNRLRTSKLAAKFKLSSGQLTNLFKREIKVSLKDYTDAYRLKLIEKELHYTGNSLKEISNRFGFTDMSHFNKFIRRHLKVNPKELR